MYDDKEYGITLRINPDGFWLRLSIVLGIFALIILVASLLPSHNTKPAIECSKDSK